MMLPLISRERYWLDRCGTSFGCEAGHRQGDRVAVTDLSTGIGNQHENDHRDGAAVPFNRCLCAGRGRAE
jgi:hypothetical protein